MDTFYAYINLFSIVAVNGLLLRFESTQTKISKK